MQQPSARILAWAESALGRRVVDARPLAGGLDAATFRLSTVGGSDVVLRVTTIDDHDDVAYQSQVLEALAGTGVPAPRAIAFADDVDDDGRRVLLQSLLPGDPTLALEPSAEWLESVVGTTLAIQTLPLAPWMHDRVEARWRKLDEAAVAELGRADRDLLDGLLDRRCEVTTTPVFGHDDFWVGNTLREGDAVVGVVDWGHAGVVSIARDITYCAVDAGICFGLGVADLLVGLFRQRVAVTDEELLLWTGHAVLASRYFAEWLTGWNGLGVPVTLDQAAERRAELAERTLRQLP